MVLPFSVNPATGAPVVDFMAAGGARLAKEAAAGSKGLTGVEAGSPRVGLVAPPAQSPGDGAPGYSGAGVGVGVGAGGGGCSSEVAGSGLPF